METVQIIALAMGVAWASGINLYAAIATLGILGATGSLDLPPDLEVLQSPAVIAAAGFMYCVEFFADKVPGVDTAWDGLHTFIRIPAAAILAAGALGEVDPAVMLVGAILGGALAATSHTLKAGTRVLINASPEPFSNIAVSLAEDTVVFAGLLGAVYHPAFFLVFVALFIAAAIWVIPKIWRGVKLLAAKIAGFFRPGSGISDAPDSGPGVSPGVTPVITMKRIPRRPAGPPAC